jgi:uncharacterized membrane protein
MKAELMSNLTILLQSVHVLFAVVWLGTLIDSELFLWPLLTRLGALNVQDEMRSKKERRKTAVIIYTVLFSGYLRGVVDGVFDRLFSLYGVLFLCASVLVTTVVVWWSCKPTRDRPIGWRLYYPSFALIFILMVAMRVYTPH